MDDFAEKALAWAVKAAEATPCPCGHARGNPEPRACGLPGIDLEAGAPDEELDLMFAVHCPSCKRIEFFMPTHVDLGVELEDEDEDEDEDDEE